MRKFDQMEDGKEYWSNAEDGSAVMGYTRNGDIVNTRTLNKDSIYGPTESYSAEEWDALTDRLAQMDAHNPSV